jgi:hypothetical protein
LTMALGDPDNYPDWQEWQRQVRGRATGAL